MVVTILCPRCSATVTADQAFCATCGFALAEPSEAVAVNPTTPIDPPTAHDAAESVELATETELAPPAVPAEDPPEPAESALEPAESALEPAPARVPGGYLAPSATYRSAEWAVSGHGPRFGDGGENARPAAPSMSVSIGAVPVAPPPLGIPGTMPVPQPMAASWPSPAPSSVGPSAPAPVATAPAWPSPTVTPSAVTPAIPAAPSAPRESKVDLATFALTATGGVLGIASFFLPWTGATSNGSGTTTYSNAGQWAFAMPAGWPLFLIGLAVLGAIVASDYIQKRYPVLVPLIKPLTGVILPMTQGGLSIGVCLLYITLPFGFGSGIVVLLLSAVLLIVGACVTIFFATERARP